jgi:uncharacterized membrane protein YphA (DoxX/SURF4 family)
MEHPGKIESELLVRHKRSKHEPLVRLDYIMLWTILVVLCILWLLGVVTSYTAGGLIHILLLAALVVLVINLVSGRRGTV